MRIPSLVASIIAASAALAATAAADTVVLKNGKVLSGVVVSKNDEEQVVINPWNSRNPAMTFEISKENVIPRANVKEVVIEDPPAVEYSRAAARPGLDADAQFALAEMCDEIGMKASRAYHLEQALARDPEHAGALAAYGESKWKTALTRDPSLRKDVRDLERTFVGATDDEVAEETWAALIRAAYRKPLHALERARRSARIEKGQREKVKLTFRSTEAPGATYAIYVPKSYDPLEPTPLLVALHGGGRGGVDETIVTGSGEGTIGFYVAGATANGFIVVAPTALVAPWQNPRNPVNDTLIEALLAEMKILFNVDLSRVYVAGHSMGGFGSWYFGSEHADWWTACAPCSGGGGPRGLANNDLPVYVYHGADDPIVAPQWDRDAVRILLGDGKKKHAKDFVYTELDGVGHGFPDWVVNDIYRFFTGRQSQVEKKGGPRKRPIGRVSSFDAKPTKEEIAAFGDPAQPFKSAEGDENLDALIADLKRGGGAGEAALPRIAERKDAKTAKKVAALLDEKKQNADVRTLAARALGAIGQLHCLDPATRALDDSDYRVVDAAITSISEIVRVAEAPEAEPPGATPGSGAPAASGPPNKTAKLGKPERESIAKALEKGSKRVATFFADSIVNDVVQHTEYEVRLASFRSLLDALARAGAKGVLDARVGPDVIAPVYLPATMYRVPGDDDSRFKDVAKNARLALAKKLRETLVALDAGAPVAKRLRDAAERWAHEPALAETLSGAAAELEP